MIRIIFCDARLTPEKQMAMLLTFQSALMEGLSPRDWINNEVVSAVGNAKKELVKVRQFMENGEITGVALSRSDLFDECVRTLLKGISYANPDTAILPAINYLTRRYFSAIAKPGSLLKPLEGSDVSGKDAIYEVVRS
jgi:hypothetical protein